MRIHGGRNIGRALVALVVLSASSVAMAAGAGAVNPAIVVTTTADLINGADGVLSLREAVARADADAGNDHIYLAEGATYDLTICGTDVSGPDNSVGDLDATDTASLTIQGLNGSTIHQTCPQRIVEATSGPLLMADLTLTGGRQAGGASVRATAPLVLTGVEVTGATMPGPSDDDDGAIYSTVRPVSISGSEIHHNATTGIYQCCGSTSSGFVVSNSSIHDNTVDGARAGGIDSPGNFQLTDSQVVDNTVNDGAALGGTGGGVMSFGAEVLRSTISGNRARMGGGIQGGFHLVDSTLSDNVAFFLGGGGNGAYQIERSTVSGNHAGFAGGGLYGGGSISGSTISGNWSADLTTGSPRIAGGIYLDGSAGAAGAVTITNSTVTANRGYVAGGIVAAQYPPEGPGPSLTVESSTIAGNLVTPIDLAGHPDQPLADDLAFADPMVGTPATDLGSLTIGGSVVGSGSPTAHDACWLEDPTIVTHGMNWESDWSCDFGPSYSDVVAGGDPGLSPLGDHGGPTETMVPYTGSPLIDRPSYSSTPCQATDQRGVSRPQHGTCDIGAVESDSALYPDGSAFTPMAPVRVLDTRDGTGGLDPVDSQTQDMVIGGTHGVPADATAVVLNVTGTDVDMATYVTVFPGAVADQLMVSNLNLEPGDTAANLVIVKLGAGGTVAFNNHSRPINVIADVMGYFSPAGASTSTFTALNPARLGDSRDHTVLRTFAPHGVQSLVVAGGASPVPAAASAVVVNITGTDVSAPTFVTAYPKGGSTPNVSNLNLAFHETRANLAIVKVGDDHSISLFNDSGTVDLVVDVVGFFTADDTHAHYVPLLPRRIAEPRAYPPLGLHTFGPGESQPLAVTGGAVPADAVGAVMNVTVTDSVNGTFVTAYPTAAGPDPGPPNASTVNVPPYGTIPNLATARIGAGGSVSFFNKLGNANVIVDLMGYYR